MMDIAKHCLAATGCSGGPGAHMIGQQVFPQPSFLAARPACWYLAVSKKKLWGGPVNKARLVAQAACFKLPAALYY